MSGDRNPLNGGRFTNAQSTGDQSTAAPGVALIRGIPVARVDLDGAVEQIRGWIGRGGAGRMVVTANAEMIAASALDPDLRGILERASMVTADGMSVVLAGRLLGTPLPARVTGYDLMERLLSLADREKYRVFLLGARPEILKGAVAAVRERYPGAVIAGAHHGYFSGSAQEAAAAETVKRGGARLLFVAMGAPRQEKWIRDHLPALGGVVAIGVGGSFDVLAGVVPRAPLWMQRSGLEWLYRVVRQPRRVIRLWKMLYFFCLVIRDRIRRKGRGGSR